MNEKTRHCGFVGIIGAPNAGKSTLINKLVGAKVSIVSPKVQTTRTRVMGIVNKDETQIVFIDTPGIFAPRKRLDRAMVSAAWQGTADAEIILLIIEVCDSSLAFDRGEKANLFASAGVEDYWVVSIPDLCAEVFRQPEGGDGHHFHDVRNSAFVLQFQVYY